MDIAQQEYERGCAHIDANWPVCVKASGLCAGKGAIVPKSIEEAKDALRKMLLENEFGAGAEEVVIEKMLTGRELSILAISDGNDFKILPVAQDHKRAYDNDEGPNTGGMGAYAPVPILDKTYKRIVEETIKPCIDGMKAEGRKFVGVLFAGLMIDDLYDET